MTIISTTVGKNPLEEMEAIIVNKYLKCSTWMQSQKWQNDLCLFPRQTIQYYSNPIYPPISNTEEAEVECFYEDLQDLLEWTSTNVLFITVDWNAKDINNE